MEGHSDSVIPLFSQVQPSSEPATTIAERGSTSRKRARPLGAKLERGQSLQQEKDRRLKMTQKFAQLQSLVPGSFPKATREVIVTEAIRYIMELEKKNKMLEELKESMKSVGGRLLLARSDRNSDVTVTVSNNVAFFGVQSVARPGLTTDIIRVFDNHKAEILAANVSVNHGLLTLTITAFVLDGSISSEKIKREILEI
ncbi:hypothetical protein L6164_025494 [Bauhinia variegata]|uniref:Uncharacterized protein n=1 Tax=Bauhinia variegata TaxID=167791 RepID=A0ACB9M0H0_BAUVA|nr:hypothetical protein L6164_025494 [Bauhinia variegata]